MAVSFGSDNHSGVHPQVLAAIAEANHGHMPAYGADPVTTEATEAFRAVFGAEASVYFVFTGTAANTLAIRALCQSYEAVVATSMAHLNEDECGAPERLTGCKLMTFAAPDGKLRPEHIASLRIEPTNPHRVLPRLVSLTQATEIGTVYRPDELRALTKAAHDRGLLVHMDGARLANAAAFLGCGLKELTTDAGLDVVSFGGTKNGLLGAEAVVFLKAGLTKDFAFHRKQNMQLASKMRYLAAQFLPYLKQDLWHTNATRANRMARILRSWLERIPGAELPWPTEANEIFVRAPENWSRYLETNAPAYLWEAKDRLLRMVCSFDTQEADIERLMLNGPQKLDRPV